MTLNEVPIAGYFMLLYTINNIIIAILIQYRVLVHIWLKECLISYSWFSLVMESQCTSCNLKCKVICSSENQTDRVRSRTLIQLMTPSLGKLGC